MKAILYLARNRYKLQLCVHRNVHKKITFASFSMMFLQDLLSISFPRALDLTEVRLRHISALPPEHLSTQLTKRRACAYILAVPQNSSAIYASYKAQQSRKLVTYQQKPYSQTSSQACWQHSSGLEIIISPATFKIFPIFNNLIALAYYL